jgi:hypothetical protein
MNADGVQSSLLVITQTIIVLPAQPHNLPPTWQPQRWAMQTRWQWPLGWPMPLGWWMPL